MINYDLLAQKLSKVTPVATLQNLQNPIGGGFVGFVGTSPPPFQKNLGEEEGQAVSHDAAELGTVKVDRPNKPPFYMNLDLALIRELITAPSESGGHGESEESVISAYLEECRKNPDFMAAWLQDARAWKAKQRPKSPPLLTSKSSAILRACTTCKHRATVGIRAVYCGGGRDDLPKAYGINHPLRRLPNDGGATCEKWLNADSDISI